MPACWSDTGRAAVGPVLRGTATYFKSFSGVGTPLAPLVPKLCLGTHGCEALLRVPTPRRTGSRASRRAFPSRAWERGINEVSGAQRRTADGFRPHEGGGAAARWAAASSRRRRRSALFGSVRQKPVEVEAGGEPILVGLSFGRRSRCHCRAWEPLPVAPLGVERPPLLLQFFGGQGAQRAFVREVLAGMHQHPGSQTIRVHIRRREWEIDIPQPGGLVPAGGDDRAAVRAERRRNHLPSCVSRCSSLPLAASHSRAVLSHWR